NCFSRKGKGAEAEKYFLDALSTYRRINDIVGESYVLNNLGLFHKNACRWGRATQFLTRALRICKESGLSRSEIRVRLNLGIVHLKKRDFAEAGIAFSKVREMASRIGDNLKYVRATLMLGVKEVKTGNLLSAEKHLLEAQVISEKGDYKRELALADEFLGDYMFTKGDYEGAGENYERALEKAREILPESDIVAEVLRRQMRVHLALKDPARVLSIGKEAMRIADNCNEVHELGFIERTIGDAYAMLKDRKRTKKYINSSIRVFLTVNNPYEAHKSGYTIGKYLFSHGDRKSMIMGRKFIKESLSYFDRAEEYEESVKCHFLLAKIECALGNLDECLLHIYETRHLADELGDSNLLRRLNRFRKKVEKGAVNSDSEIIRRTGIEDISNLVPGDSNLGEYLNHILNDLMSKLTAHHGFVTLFGSSEGDSAPLVLVRRGISENNTTKIANWFLSRDSDDPPQEFLVTDIENDRRISKVRYLLPDSTAPVYFHPIVKKGKCSGLLFFQSGEDSSGIPRVGTLYDVVSTYAGFISFLLKGVINRGRTQESSDKIKQNRRFETVITRNESMLNVCNMAHRVAGTDSTVLLMGETGTGKGLIAKAIHELSDRRGSKYVHVNCAALPENILESELFGHVKGAFTGAVLNKKGLFSEADGGTVFLDEIGKMPLSLQGKLLQFLDTRKIRPVGSNKMKDVDIRLIFASKVDLLNLCRRQKMLEDFYYRINDFPLTIPPLRERPEDIKLLAEHYLSYFTELMKKNLSGFNDEAYKQMLNYNWGGNVRELEKVVKRAVILANERNWITPDLLLFDSSFVPEESCSGSTLPEKISALERDVISKSLDNYSWNRKAVSRALDISYPTLLNKISKYGITKSG
ncbi:MAG TPA: sigma 54-interacting transcriptional regulator, partial [Candidatus Krumholzibacteriaceae bacterium]|nr:sigma 54-interacting transcriptional regulator [Candidatus Krumholzibacteriaceae bacterium]